MLVRSFRAKLRKDYAFVVRDGVIAVAGEYRDLREHARKLGVRSFPDDRLVVPGFINGHSHAYQILLARLGRRLAVCEKWRSDALYRVVPQLTPDDVYWTFVAAFSEMLAAGITTVAEFFYLNGAGNEHAEAAIRAAHDTGIRLVLARTWMDAEYAPPHFAKASTRRLSGRAISCERYPEAHVCVAPHSLHAASHEMIRAAAAFARELDCMLHVHVAEARYEGEETLRRFGRTPIALLDELGALDERTVAIHAIYLSDDDRNLLATRGARVIHNPMTNQYLGDGICDVARLQSLGVTMGLGTDADVHPSIIDEMRAAALLQKILQARRRRVRCRARRLRSGPQQGARALRAVGGDLVAGVTGRLRRARCFEDRSMVAAGQRPRLPR